MTIEQSNIQPAAEKEGSTAFAWFHATSVNGGAMCMGGVIASYFSVHMTDTLKLPAASASLIMLIASLWDAFNDPMMGVIADRTKTKWGRYRPYFLIAPILITLFGTLIWINPGITGSGLFLYVLLTYLRHFSAVLDFKIHISPSC